MAKIMIVVPYLYDGGAERVASRWANILVEKKYNVSIVTFIRNNNEYFLNEKITRFNVYDDINEYNRKKIRKNVEMLRAIINDYSPDVIIPFLSDCLILCFYACKKTDVKIIATIRNSPWNDPSNFLLRKIRDHFLIRCNEVIYQNEEQTKYLHNKVKKSYIVCNPITDDFLKVKKENYSKIKKIIAVGRLCKQKNFKLAIDAITFLNKKGYDFYLDIYGDGEARDTLNKYIQKSDMSKYIKLCGKSTNIFEIEKNYDLFIMTSIYEGFPNALLEAMTIGLPVISTSCPTGPKSLINHRQNGILLSSYNYKELAEIILEINDVEFLRKIGTNARADCLSNYCKENSCFQLEKAIDFAIGDK